MRVLVIICALFLTAIAQARDMTLELTESEHTELNKLQGTFKQYTKFFTTSAYAAQYVAVQCQSKGVQISTFIMQEPIGEESVGFDVSSVQAEIFSGLSPDVTGAINKLAFIERDQLIMNVSGPLRSTPYSKQWCINEAPLILERLLHYFNRNVHDSESSTFKEYLEAKKLYLHSIDALESLKAH